jgi:hypothetical protein
MLVKVKTIFSGQALPWAQCLGVDDETPCPDEWVCPEGPDTKQAAKDHAGESVGHRVRVVRQAMEVYKAEEQK